MYVCSLLSGDVAGNIANARRYSRYAVDIPIAPHLLFPQFLNDNDITKCELGLHFGNVLMSHCCEVWVFGVTMTKGSKIPLVLFTKLLGSSVEHLIVR